MQKVRIKYNALKISRKKKKLILKICKAKKFFLLLKNNQVARKFIENKMKEKGVDGNLDEMLSDEFFAGLVALLKLENIGCVVFNHALFQFVENTKSIPYKEDIKTELPDFDDTEEIEGNLNCPSCGIEYDEIDYEYQICTHCKFNNNKK